MSKPTRSPLLGYNHNVKYKGRIYHVQTEDSGPANPHLFTHLYFEGTILATKRHQYDRESPEEVVRSLMQGQHKAILKDLKQALYDGRLASFFGQRGEDFEVGVTLTEMPPVTSEMAAAAAAAGAQAALAAATAAAAAGGMAPPSPADVALDLDAVPQDAGSTPPPEMMPPAPTALPHSPGGPGVYQMKKDTQRRFAPPRPSDPMLPLVVFDPPATPAPVARAAPPQASVGRTTESLTRLTGGMKPLDATPPPKSSQVVVQRQVVVGGPARAVGPGGRPRRPAQPIPYVVKEGSHPLVNQPTPPPQRPPGAPGRSIPGGPGGGVQLPPNPVLPSRAVSPPPRAGRISAPVPLMAPHPPTTNAPRTSNTGAAPPPGQSSSELISDKSLDEVILAYLSQGEKE